MKTVGAGRAHGKTFHSTKRCPRIGQLLPKPLPHDQRQHLQVFGILTASLR
jgi:hypothetical protein